MMENKGEITPSLTPPDEFDRLDSTGQFSGFAISRKIQPRKISSSESNRQESKRQAVRFSETQEGLISTPVEPPGLMDAPRLDSEIRRTKEKAREGVTKIRAELDRVQGK